MTPPIAIDDPSAPALADAPIAHGAKYAASSQLRQTRSKRSSAFGWALLAAAGLLVALAGPALVGRVYTADDLGAFHLPMRGFYQQCLARGDRFDWSPQLYCGFYLTGEGQVGTYHPWHWLLYRLLPLGAAFDVECLANYPLMLLGVYCFLRLWRLRRDAALLGGVMFTFSGFCLLHFVHVNCIAVVAHVPWLLLAIDIAIRGRSRRRRWLAGTAVALFSGSQILLGYPQVVAMSLVLEACYAVMMLRRVGSAENAIGEDTTPERRIFGMPWWRSSMLLFWKALGFAIGCAQLLPTLEAVGLSSRQSVDAAFRGWGSLDPLNLFQFVAPYLFQSRVVGQNTHEFGCYAGSVTLVLAIWCVASGAAPKRLKPLVRAAAGLAAFGLLFALGERGPLYPLISWLPPFNKFRFPCRAIVLVHLALAILAAIGWMALGRIDSELEQSQHQNSRGIVPLWSLAVLSAVLAIGGPHWWADHTSSVWQIWYGPILMFSAALLTICAIRKVAWARPALVMLMAADLGAYGLSYAVYPHALEFDQYIAATSVPPGPPDGRVAADLMEPNQPGLRQGDAILLRGWNRVDGYAGLAPARQLDYHGAAALRVAGAGWIAADVAVPGLEIPRRSFAAWLPLPDPPLPRARLVTNLVASLDPAHDLGRIPLETTALVSPASKAAIELDSAPSGTVTIVEDRPGLIRLRTDAPGRQLLVISENFHPGWIATLAGKQQPIVRVNGDFMGCVVGPGQADLHLEFRPTSLIAGRRLSAFGLSLWMAVVLIGIYRGKEQPLARSPRS
jgi:hypothetical protein